MPSASNSPRRIRRRPSSDRRRRPRAGQAGFSLQFARARSQDRNVMTTPGICPQDGDLPERPQPGSVPQDIEPGALRLCPFAMPPVSLYDTV
jgi:hypothetical protein